MAKIPFNVDANTARLIGRENVSKADGAIIELIKNAYDADATICALFYDKNDDKLWIVDNGCGMNDAIVKRHWMSIGYSDKDVDLRSDKGRIKTGAKGIGRFALDRLGETCTMYSCKKGEYIVWDVNWEQFVRGKNINEIYADLNSFNFIEGGIFNKITNSDFKNLVKKSFNSGTIFEIRHLRDVWDDDFCNKLKLNLTSLIPPSLNNSFNVYFFQNDTNIEKAYVVSEFLNTYDYSVDFTVSEDGEIKIIIKRNEFDFGTRFDYVIKNAGFNRDDIDYFNGKPIIHYTNVKSISNSVTAEKPYKLGAFSGTICYYKIVSQEKNEEKFYYKPFENRKSLIKKYGGIKIYRDGFRVRPYGESGTPQFDWLLLSGRHYNSAYAASSKSGNWTVDASQVMGEINISRLNGTLNDQANRQGIFEDYDFDLLKKIIVEVLSYMENDRQDVMRKLSALWDKEHPTKKAEEDIKAKYERYKKSKKTQEKTDNQKENKDEYIHVEEAQKAIDGKNAQINDLEDENRLLRSLATAGIAINTYMHEIRELLHHLKMLAKEADESYRIDHDIKKAVGAINEVRNITKDFESWFQVTLESVRADRRTRRRYNIIELIDYCIKSWKSALGNNITFQTEFGDAEIMLDCFPYEIDSIFHNLISNSYKSFIRSQTVDKKINIKVAQNEGKIIIDYSDTGEGLKGEFKRNPDKILKQMVTGDEIDGEKQGTGLGMWIVNNIVADYKGKIDLSKNIKTDMGFYVEIII